MKIAIINPVSSGKCLVKALEDLGGEVVKIFDHSLKEYAGNSYIAEDIYDTANFLKSENVHAIVNGSEFGTSLTDELSNILGLPGNQYDKRQARINKFNMIKTLESFNVKVPHTQKITSKEELLRFLDLSPNYPVFVKPAASAGSDSCKKCDTRDEVISIFNNSFKEKNVLGKENDSIVLQEYVEGHQYIVNTVSKDSNHFITEIYSVNIEEVNNTPIYRDISTLNYDKEKNNVDLLSNYVIKCLDGLGIENGAAHTEIRMTSEGPVIIEVNSRIMGPVLDIDAFNYGFGYSQASILAESIINPELFLKRTLLAEVQPKKYFSMIFIRCPHLGRIVNRKGFNIIRRLQGFHSIVNYPPIGFVSKNPLLTTGDFGIAYFAHEELDVLNNSLSIFHQMENEGVVYEVECSE